jgi:hypothetical protein
VKVIDFGVAKATAKASETRAGTLKGKLAYMAPEQVRGEPLDRRCDVFALGIVLYELTTGARPFDATNEVTLIDQISKCVPVPPSQRVAYPAELERIVMRALAKNPAERYGTAQELKVALEEFARQRKLPISSVVLARMMQSLFPGKADPARSMATATLAEGTGPFVDDFAYSVVVERGAVAMPAPELSEEVDLGDLGAVGAPRALAKGSIAPLATLATQATRARPWLKPLGFALLGAALVTAAVGVTAFLRSPAAAPATIAAPAVETQVAAPTPVAPAVAPQTAAPAAPAAPAGRAAPTETVQAAPTKSKPRASKPKPARRRSWDPDSALLPP